VRLNLSKTIDGPMRKYPRIEIDQKAYDGLSIEAVLRHKTTREIATQAILTSISREALSVLDHTTIGPETTSPEDIATKRPLDHKTPEGAAIESGESTGPDAPQKPRRLADNQTALEQIRLMWREHPRPSFAEMSKILHYPKSTIAERAKRMQKEGLLD
jgi:hypothetical protein